MKRELAEEFSREVDSYRNALLYCARKSDWDSFKDKAGRLFDYVEAVEHSELERRFFAIFTPILAVLVLVVLALVGGKFEVNPELMRMKQTVILAAVIASTFELYFFLNFRMYKSVRTTYSMKRRENFIRNMEQDFRSYAFQSERRAA